MNAIKNNIINNLNEQSNAKIYWYQIDRTVNVAHYGTFLYKYIKTIASEEPYNNKIVFELQPETQQKLIVNQLDKFDVIPDIILTYCNNSDKKISITGLFKIIDKCIKKEIPPPHIFCVSLKELRPSEKNKWINRPNEQIRILENDADNAYIKRIELYENITNDINALYNEQQQIANNIDIDDDDKWNNATEKHDITYRRYQYYILNKYAYIKEKYNREFAFMDKDKDVIDFYNNIVIERIHEPNYYNNDSTMMKTNVFKHKSMKYFNIDLDIYQKLSWYDRLYYNQTLKNVIVNKIKCS